MPYIIVYSYISSESSNFSYSFRILNYQQTLIDYLKKMCTYQIPSQLKKKQKKKQINFKTKNKIPIKLNSILNQKKNTLFKKKNGKKNETDERI